MKTALCITAVVAICGAIGWCMGVLLDKLSKWHIGQNNTDAEHFCESCENCKHGEKEWDEEPCFDCDDVTSMWEAKDADSTIQ